MTDTMLGTQKCDACGATDTDPMIHVAYGSYQVDERTTVSEPSFHFDCLPTDLRAQLAQAPDSHSVTLAAIDAAESGTKGAALREFILAQPSDNESPEG